MTIICAATFLGYQAPTCSSLRVRPALLWWGGILRDENFAKNKAIFMMVSLDTILDTN